MHTTAPTTDPATGRYLAPDAAARRVLNPLVRFLLRRGLGVRGGRILHVRGRRTGEWRSVPVNPLPLGGERYLVAPRGNTEWARNLRVSGAARLQLGRRYDRVTAVELDDADKPPVIRAYLARWSAETSRFFDGLDATSTDAEIVALAPGVPVFRLVPAAS